MQKTALDIVQRFARRNNEGGVPSTLFGNTDPSTIQMLELLYDVCEELRQSKVWVQQKRSHEFSTSTTEDSYQLPPDYYAGLTRTQWNQSENNLLIGPMSDSSFTLRLHGEVPSTTNYSYRLFGFDENSSSAGGQFKLNPAPSSVQTLSLEYISRNLFIPSTWIASTAYSLNNKVNLNGNIYNCSNAGTTGATGPSGTSTAITDGSAEWDFYNEPYETILADTDLCLFDDDLVRLGLRAKWYEEHGGDFQDPKAEFRRKVAQAVARYEGSSVGSMSRRYNGPAYRVPYSSWSF